MIFVDFPTVRQKYDHITDDDLVSSGGDRPLEELYPYEYEIRRLAAFISRMRKFRSNLHDRGLNDEDIVSMSKNSWASEDIQNLSIFIQDEPRRERIKREREREREYEAKLDKAASAYKEERIKRELLQGKTRHDFEYPDIPVWVWLFFVSFFSMTFLLFWNIGKGNKDIPVEVKIESKDLMVKHDLDLRALRISNTRNEWERNRLIREYQDIYNRYHNTNITFDSQFDFLPD
jgi:hypothetical protein